MKLTETQRIELALFPQIFLGVLVVGASTRDHPDFETTVKLLRQASLEPLAGMNTAAINYVLTRCKGVHKQLEGRFFLDQTGPAKVACIAWYGLEFLLRAEVLELTEEHTLARAMAIMTPMFDYMFAEEKVEASARKQAVRMLDWLATRGYYKAWPIVRDTVV
jgi:hypothetical protein